MTVYYVSNSGSDSNDGLSSLNAWLTCAKVNSFSFQPGDKILFRRGDVWREVLQLSADGTAGAPITIGAFGSGARPVFRGSDVVLASAFAQHTGVVYVASVGTVGDVVYAGKFLRQVADVATVGVTSMSWYHNAGLIYINVGGAPASDIENCVRNKCIYTYQRAYHRYQFLAADNTTRTDVGSDDAGFGFLVHVSNNVRISDCVARRCQKHHMGDISGRDVFWERCYATDVGNNIDASGATHYVSYGSAAQETSGYSRWHVCTTGNCVDAQGVERFSLICHGDAIRRLYFRSCRFNSSIELNNQADSDFTDEWQMVDCVVTGTLRLQTGQANALIKRCHAQVFDDRGSGNILIDNQVMM